MAAKKIDSKIAGVQIGAITYSFNRIANPDPTAILPPHAKLLLIGDAEAEAKFHKRYARR